MRSRKTLRGSLGIFALLASIAAPIAGQDEIVARGNQTYQEGDYASAIEAYEAVRNGGFTSAGLEYNLGNAYFKSGSLGRAILHWERALALSPGDPDTQANLELARSLTVDAIEPMPTFWLVSAASWWVGLFSRGALVALVATGWLTMAGALVTWILSRNESVRSAARWTAVAGAAVVLVLGTNLLLRELGIAQPERAVIMVEAVAARAAPAQDDDLTLFEVHEGTRVRLDQRTGEWAEVVLDDGKVGWIPLSAMEII
jgi:tetratricopeptide (TPR) repeat protein